MVRRVFRNLGFGSGSYHLSPVYKAKWLQVPGWGDTQYSLWYLLYNRYTRQIADVCNDELYKATPWKINMEPENDGLEDDFPFQLGDF